MNNTKISWAQKTWNPIPNFDGYFASSDGYILSKKQGHTRVLNPIEGNDRHLYVFLYDGQGNSKKMYVRVMSPEMMYIFTEYYLPILKRG